MTDEEKILFNKLKENKNGYIRLNFVQVDFLVNLIEKKEKVIDEMAISLMHNKNNKFNNMTLGEVEKYFYGKVENEG